MIIVGNKCLENTNFFLAFVLHFVVNACIFSIILCFKCVCVETQGKKKILPVKQFSVFSNRIVYIRSVNRQFGYPSHP